MSDSNCRVKSGSEELYRDWQFVRDDKEDIQFNTEDYFTSNCGITSFERFEGQANVPACKNLIKFGMSQLQKGQGVVASLPIKDNYKESIEEYECWDKALRALRFRVVKEFQNPNSGNIVRLYFRLVPKYLGREDNA